MKKTRLAITLAFILFIAGSLHAQESLMDLYSNVYLEKLIATAKENYPRIGALKARTKIAESQVVSQKSAWLDGLSFNYIYKPDNTLDIVNPTFFNGYQIAVSFSVTELFQKGSNVRQAKEAVKVSKFEQDEYNLTLETQVKTRYIAYVLQDNTLKQQYKIYADAKILFDNVSSRYNRGQVTVTDYISANQALTTSLQARMSAEANRLAAKASLEELTVKKLEEIQ